MCTQIPTIHRFHALILYKSKELCHSQWISPSSIEAQIWPQLTHFMTGFFCSQMEKYFFLHPTFLLNYKKMVSPSQLKMSKTIFQSCFKLLLFSFSPSNSRKATPLESSLHAFRGEITSMKAKWLELASFCPWSRHAFVASFRRTSDVRTTKDHKCCPKDTLNSEFYDKLCVYVSRCFSIFPLSSMS